MSQMHIAGVQMDTEIGATKHNLARILHFSNEVARRGATLAVFPECALSGYVFDTPEEARESASELPGPATDAVITACRATGLYVVFGCLEASGGDLYNSAVLCGPEGLIGVYRKTHLPFLGVDRFTRPGPGPYRVLSTPAARLGLLICYDLRFPEASRCLTLLGADILVLPTNWPEGADASPDFTAPARAVENRVFVVAVNRAGVERGVSFIGKSQICDPGGKRLALADTTGETIIEATVDPLVARKKRLAIQPGVFEIDTVGDRRPELYQILTETPANRTDTSSR